MGTAAEPEDAAAGGPKATGPEDRGAPPGGLVDNDAPSDLREAYCTPDLDDAAPPPTSTPPASPPPVTVASDVDAHDADDILRAALAHRDSFDISGVSAGMDSVAVPRRPS
jgi:hypothetical protein